MNIVIQTLICTRIFLAYYHAMCLLQNNNKNKQLHNTYCIIQRYKWNKKKKKMCKS